MSKTIVLTLMGMVFCAAAHVGAQTPPAPRAAPLQTPAQRMEAAQNLSNTEADSALAQLNAYRKAMGLSVLVKNAPHRSRHAPQLVPLGHLGGQQRG